jgi:Tol biopolymer transport system component
MDDLLEILEQDLRRVGPAPFDLEQLATEREGVRRTRRLQAGIVGLVVVAALIGLLAAASRTSNSSEPVTTPSARTNGWIVYTIIGRGLDEPQGIYVTRPGTDPKRIVAIEGRALAHCPSFSPDGSMLSYTEAGDPRLPTSDVEIVVTAVDGSAVPVGPAHRIVAPSVEGRRTLCAHWSPDGGALAVSARGSLWVVPIDGGEPRRLAEGPIHGIPAWSPDGSTIAGTSDGYVVLISVDDGSWRLVRTGTYGGSVSWSPDGRAIAVAVEDGRDGRPDRDIAVIDVETGTDHVLPLGPGVRADEPDWSPDGEQIAFVDEGRIHLVDPDTGHLATLGVAVLDPSPWEIDAVDWSPDGKRLLAFGTDYQPELAYGLVSIAADGSGEPVLISPLTIAFYDTPARNFDWQGVPT